MENQPGEEFRHAVLKWYHENGREFYWRTESLTAFELLITELLLNRTPAERVDSVGKEILEELDDPSSVVKMDRSRLSEFLHPLGLQKKRSKHIQTACRDLVAKYDGEIPSEREKLLSIDGIGHYVADSILTIWYGEPVLVLDRNVISVAEHYLGIEPPSDARQDRTIRPALEPLVPIDSPEKFNWGLIDVGAALRTGDFVCPDCPLDYPCVLSGND